MQVREAKCVCGSVKVEAKGEPAAVVICHCKDCQRRTGSVFGVGAYFTPDQVSVSGTTQAFICPTDSGEEFITHFCPNVEHPYSGSWSLSTGDLELLWVHSVTPVFQDLFVRCGNNRSTLGCTLME